MSVTGVVLAAGLATRMGETKQLVDLGGVPMLATTVGNALRSRLTRVIVVVGHDADRVRNAVPDDAVVVENLHYERGNLSSFRTGVEAAGAGPVMLLLGDMPGLGPEIIDACLDRYLADRPWAVVARYTDGVGHPFVFSPEAVLRSAEYEGRKALYRMLREQTAGRVVEVAFDFPAPLDVNTPDDVARYQEETS